MARSNLVPYAFVWEKCNILDFLEVTEIQHFQICFAQKLPGRFKQNFILSLHGMQGMKICSNVPGHMTMPT